MGSPSSASALIKPSVAFFGAADNRPSLFFLTVTLQSVRRFHRKSAYFALLPEAEAAGSSRLAMCKASLGGWTWERRHCADVGHRYPRPLQDGGLDRWWEHWRVREGFSLAHDRRGEELGADRLWEWDGDGDGLLKRRLGGVRHDVLGCQHVCGLVAEFVKLN